MGLISVRSEVHLRCPADQLLDGPSGRKNRPRNGLVPRRGLAFGVVKEKGVSIRVSIELRSMRVDSRLQLPLVSGSEHVRQRLPLSGRNDLRHEVSWRRMNASQSRFRSY
jgi:hypothetical protein